MKPFLLFAITIYQRIISSFFKSVLGTKTFCRFSPSCSEYAKISIKKHGVCRGCILAVRRVFNCRPNLL